LSKDAAANGARLANGMRPPDSERRSWGIALGSYNPVFDGSTYFKAQKLSDFDKYAMGTRCFGVSGSGVGPIMNLFFLFSWVFEQGGVPVHRQLLEKLIAVRYGKKKGTACCGNAQGLYNLIK